MIFSFEMCDPTFKCCHICDDILALILIDQVTEYHFLYYYVNEFTWKYTVMNTTEFCLLLYQQQRLKYKYWLVKCEVYYVCWQGLQIC
jgi:hypothetical protein